MPSGRTLWRVAGALVALAVVAGLVTLLVMKLRPAPAQTVDGSRAQGTVSGIDLSGARTYDNSRLHFKIRYPDGWSLRETGASQAAEGDYITLAFLPKSSSGQLSPPKIEVVPDPQGFSAEAVVKMKWGSGDTTLTVTTSTVDAAGAKGVEVRASSPDDTKPLYTWESVVIAKGRLYLMRFETSDRDEFDSVATEARRIFSSIQAY